MYVSSATTTDGTKVILTYDQPLSPDTASIWDFIVRVDGSQRYVSDAVTSAADNTEVELSLSTAIQIGETVTVSYTDPSSNDDDYAIQSLSYGEDADSFSDQIVTNNSTVAASSPSESPASAAPVFQSASTSTDGTIVILSYDQTLDSVDTPQTSAFDVQVNGTNIDVSYVSIYGSDVELTLATAIQSGEPVTVSYADPTSGDDTNAIQSLGDGNDAASLVSQSVTNAVTASTSTAPVAAPIFSSLDSATTVEKAGEGNIVYQAVADHQSPFTFSLEAADQNLFSIDSNTGAVRLLEEADFDRRQNYNFTVRATDAFGNYSDKAISLAVEDSSLAFWKEGGYRVDSAALKDALPSSNAVVLKDRYNRVLSDQISRSWDGVSVIKSNGGYRMLQVGERGRRRGKYRIAEINADGVLQSVGSWVDKDQAVADRYQELFELDLNNDGQSALPPAVDVDLDGFVDGLGHYRLMGNGNAVDLNDERGHTLSPKTSRRWNAVVSKQIGSGFQVVIQGERGRRRSQYQVWTTDANGRLIDKTSWLDGSVLTRQGYEQMFNRDFNNDRSVELSAVSQFSDANSDGFVDGLGHYMLMGLSLSNTVDFKDNRGRRLSSKSSRSWNALSAAPNSNDPSSGFEVLIQGERGRRRSQYQVWSTDANGQLTSKTPWMDGTQLAQQGYETTFTKDFNGDELIGVPSGSGLLDQDNNGLVDGITHYALLDRSGGTVQAIDLKDTRGRVLSDASSRSWNIIHAVDNGNGFDVLVQGERGRRRSQYRLWRADQTGLITDRSRWLTGDQLASDGYESIFGLDFNNNGSIPS